MVRKCLKSKSKRLTCHKRFKIIRKVKEHHRKLRKDAKKNLNRPNRKDPGVPCILPFREEFLSHVQETKKKLDEVRLYNLTHKEKFNIDNPTQSIKVSLKKEVNEVIQESDVILEVLDARDPLGSRCIDVEEQILAANKHLVPRSNLESWLNYLRKSRTVLPFKANTQQQFSNLSGGKMNMKFCLSEELKNRPTKGLGVDDLFSLLGNYSRTFAPKISGQNTRMGCLMVGIIGLPNTGKSALINTLKRQKVCASGNLPGLTKQSQRIKIDKNLFLIDSPGLLLSKSTDKSELVLRNCLKPELLPDPIPAVEAILRRCSNVQLNKKYNIDKFSDVTDFLVQLAHRLGKLRKGGLPNMNLAARSIINDWITGRLTYLTHPPESETVQDMSDNIHTVSSPDEMSIDIPMV